MDPDLTYITRELNAARSAYARKNPERAQMLPFSDSTTYHLINSVQFLVTEVEALRERVDKLEDPKQWVSNAGPIEIAADPQPEDVVQWRAQDHEAGDIDPDKDEQAKAERNHNDDRFDPERC